MSPGSPRLVFLINHSRISCQVNRNLIFYFSNFYSGYCILTGKLQGQFIVPIQLCQFAGFKSYHFSIVNVPILYIDYKSLFYGFSCFSWNGFQHQSTRLCFHCCCRCPFRLSQRYRYFIISFGYRN
ncbi:hypothetical protein D3C86_1011700 [compost metagenome]